MAPRGHDSDPLGLHRLKEITWDQWLRSLRHMRGTAEIPHVRINGQPLVVPLEIAGRVPKIIDNGVRFTSRKRTVAATEFIVHESVTHTAADCEWILQWRRNKETNKRVPRHAGVHLQADEEGRTRYYHDLAADRLGHIGSPHNDHSVGFEITNIYYPTRIKANAPWHTEIDAPWAHRGGYVVPLQEQLEACASFVSWLSGPGAPLPIPRNWPALDNDRKRWAMCPVPGLGDRPTPGIYAHHHVGRHADGAFPVLYAWLRVEIGMKADDALAEALRLATGGGRWLDVAHLLG